MAKDNRTIGRFHLDGIPPAPRGIPQIEVIFDIDANGILHVTAKDKVTGKEQKIRIEASSGLSDDEIKRMKTEAEANAEADKKAKEEADKVNMADTMIFQTEKQLTEYGDKLSQGNKENIQRALSKLKDAHKEKNLADIDTALNELNTAWQGASQEMYNATNNTANTTAGCADANANADTQNNTAGEVTDVDFEEVKDDKK